MSQQQKIKLSSYKNQNGYNLTYTITDFARMYEKEYPRGCGRKKAISIMKDFFKDIQTEIVENKYHFKIPLRLGTVRIVKRKCSNNLNKHRVDWKKTKELDKKVYHLNIHSDRYYFKWVWFKKRNNIHFKNKKFYLFKPLRSSTRKLAHYIKECAADPEMRDYDCLM